MKMKLENNRFIYAKIDKKTIELIKPGRQVDTLYDNVSALLAHSIYLLAFSAVSLIVNTCTLVYIFSR